MNAQLVTHNRLQIQPRPEININPLQDSGLGLFCVWLRRWMTNVYVHQKGLLCLFKPIQWCQ